MAPAWAWAADTDWTAAPHRWQLNMGEGATKTARIAYESHMIVFTICVVIGVIVFGAMAWSMFRFRKSKGAVAAQFSHNTKAEIVWTLIPVLILIGLAWPATRNLIRMYDTRDAEMTVKVTGYQWMWKYEYMGEGVSYTSRLARKSDDEAHGVIAAIPGVSSSSIEYDTWFFPERMPWLPSHITIRIADGR